IELKTRSRSCGFRSAYRPGVTIASASFGVTPAPADQPTSGELAEAASGESGATFGEQFQELRKGIEIVTQNIGPRRGTARSREEKADGDAGGAFPVAATQLETPIPVLPLSLSPLTFGSG